jgi:hypothetical protein
MVQFFSKVLDSKGPALLKVQKVVKKRCKNVGPEVADFTEDRGGHEGLECRRVGK